MHRRQLILAGLLALVAALLLPLAPASAAERVCSWENGSYICTIPGDPGTPGGGTDEPTCDVSVGTGWVQNGGHAIGSPYCSGTTVCVNGEFFAPLALPDGEKPSEDSEAKVRYCRTAAGAVSQEVFWTDEEDPPTLAERAQTAIGNIDLGTGQVTISPAGRTLVNLDTWFWLDGNMPQQATGTEALGLVAIATFQSMEVTTGDGSTKTCPYVTTAEAAQTQCAYTYRRSSGGQSYTVSAVATYGLRFEIGGQDIGAIPGAPTTLDGPVTQAPLTVSEVQSRVTKTR